ncbi:MAG: LysR family transcriptional regulator, partial [Planctomycetales bacterium]
LANTLNFTEAARCSGVSQPSLTKAIRRLENELGGPLIYRDGKDSRLTALGREIQSEFMRIEMLFDGVRELAENSVGGRASTISIGVATTIAPSALSEFVKHILLQLPDVRLDFEPLLPGENEAEVLSGKYNACILPGMPKPNFKLTTVKLFTESIQLAMAADHHLAVQDKVEAQQMAHEPYLDRIRCEFRTQLMEHFLDRNIVMRPRIQSEREDMIQQLVAAGLGVCNLPERSIIVPGIVVRPISGLELSRDVTIVAISGSGSPMEIRQIMKMAEAFDWSK